MHALAEENARRTMQLCHYYTFCSIDDKSTICRHVRNCSKEHVLNDRTEVLMVLIRAIKLHLSLQWDTISQAPLKALINRVTRRIYIIIEELKHKIIARVCNWEVLCEHLIQTVILTFLGRRVKLQEVAERPQLNVKKIRKWIRIWYACEIDSIVNDL